MWYNLEYISLGFPMARLVQIRLNHQVLALNKVDMSAPWIPKSSTYPTPIHSSTRVRHRYLSQIEESV